MTKLRSGILTVSTLAGTIIGVGLFSLPYITSKVGIWMMAGYFLILSFIVIKVHLYFADVVLATKGSHRLPGYAGIHLGRWGKITEIISVAFGFFGALLAYLIIGGEFLTELLAPMLGGNNVVYTLVYFAAGALLIFFGIKAIAKIEMIGLILFSLILGVIFFRGLPVLNIDNLLVNWRSAAGNFFLPYGPILFSLWGAALIPEAKEMLGNNPGMMKKIITASIIIPVVVYLWFIVSVLGITGSQTSTEAIIGLKNYLGDGIVRLGLFFGVLTTFTSFIALGLTLKNVLWYDLKIGEKPAWGIACFLPLGLYFLGLKNFIGVIGFIGAVMLAVDGIIIILMHRRILPHRSHFWSCLLIAFFALGIVYEIINLI